MSRFSDYMARRKAERTSDEAALAEAFKDHFGREGICQTCDGRGLLNADRPGFRACTACGGSGKSGRRA